MDDQAAHVANIGNMTMQFQTLDKLLACLDPTSDFKTENTACALWRIFLTVLIPRTRWQTSVVN